jgi:hypothetical protein
METSKESPIQRFEKVASPVHTLFLLLVLAAVAALGYFSILRSPVLTPDTDHRFLPRILSVNWRAVMICVRLCF